MKDTLILAIESSCDETAASVVKNGRTLLSNVISSHFIPYMEALCRKSRHASILRK